MFASSINLMHILVSVFITVTIQFEKIPVHAVKSVFWASSIYDGYIIFL